ncbi:MAG: amidophosphoribosyltransferase [Bdellovibrionales bacterium GWB1_52_6]|nr:MAG: amidophosphoribosyltransferase [Bdellovibrionales bacterium GWB1_52_6]OFZ04136.1 MAG: amidophosphoribosyltransferase [Bdellovibrionales bacterium GWA1_52_35]HCM40476.1 amidophosphoribosyltransferase [Bdellovibrionales bacterium]
MCGIVGIIGSSNAAREAFLGLTTLQHRGQDAAGILSFDSGEASGAASSNDGFHRVKNLGLVDSVFNRENIAGLTGNIAVGHARYSTTGRGDLIEVQPFLLNYPFGIGMVHNGNIVNAASLASELRSKHRRHLLTHSDTEVVLNLLADGLSRCPANVPDTVLDFESLCQAVSEVFGRLNGSYSILTLIADQGLVAFRDPNGIRPLVWGSRKEGSGRAYMVASESAALSFLGYEDVRDLQPGELLYIDQKGCVHIRRLVTREHRPCMFEWVYFASPESVIDETPVYGARIGLGNHLATLVRSELAARGLEADIVVPVPDTARIAAIALSEELGVPYREVLIKNRYIKRTFILDSQEKRQTAVNLKLSPVRSEIAGKRVLLVDDSIVRGTTSRKLVELVRQAGASKVYFVSTCPPIQSPCFYGIDFPEKKELIAYERNSDEIQKELGADAVIFQSVEGLQKAISQAGKLKFSPCMACLTGDYPTDVSGFQQFADQRGVERQKKEKP